AGRCPTVEADGRRQEAGEGRAERDLAERGEPHADPHHVLLGDVALDETIRELSQEVLGVRGVLHLTIEREQPRLHATELLERRAECLARSDRFTLLVFG